MSFRACQELGTALVICNPLKKRRRSDDLVEITASPAEESCFFEYGLKLVFIHSVVTGVHGQSTWALTHRTACGGFFFYFLFNFSCYLGVVV